MSSSRSLRGALLLDALLSAAPDAVAVSAPLPTREPRQLEFDHMPAPYSKKPLRFGNNRRLEARAAKKKRDKVAAASRRRNRK